MIIIGLELVRSSAECMSSLVCENVIFHCHTSQMCFVFEQSLQSRLYLTVYNKLLIK